MAESCGIYVELPSMASRNIGNVMFTPSAFWTVCSVSVAQNFPLESVTSLFHALEVLRTQRSFDLFVVCDREVVERGDTARVAWVFI